MAYSVRGRVWVGLTCALMGGTCAGACGSSSSGSLPGAGGAGGDDGSEPQVECRSDKDCRKTDQLCGDDNVCVDCIVDSHCGAGEVCTAAGSCKKVGINDNSSEGGAPSDGGTKNKGGTNSAGTNNGGTSSGGSNNGGTSSAGTSNDGGSVDPGEGGAPTNGNCVSEPIDPCVGLPHFKGTQTVDGDSSDFCGIAPFALEMAASPFYRAPQAPLGSGTRATFRVAWSAAALHVFIQVQDSSVHPNQSGSLLNVWNGDNIEFYASPKPPAGLFNATRTYEQGAFQVIAAPPGLTLPAGHAAFTSTGAAYAVPALEYTVTTSAVGYNVEAQIPWTDATPTAGAKMGFDAGLSDDVDGLSNINSEYRDYYALLFNASYHGYCTTYYEPYCDSRNWCTPVALP